eukprot:scpid47097/ scgid1457/ 
MGSLGLLVSMLWSKRFEMITALFLANVAQIASQRTNRCLDVAYSFEDTDLPDEFSSSRSLYRVVKPKSNFGYSYGGKSQPSGPDFDHTIQQPDKGHFLVFEQFLCRTFNVKVPTIVQTPAQRCWNGADGSNASASCTMQVSYSMRGPYVGQLWVGDMSSVRDRLSGDQGTGGGWKSLSVSSLFNAGQPIQFRFQVKCHPEPLGSNLSRVQRRPFANGDIALDDITIQCSCADGVTCSGEQQPAILTPASEATAAPPDIPEGRFTKDTMTSATMYSEGVFPDTATSMSTTTKTTIAVNTTTSERSTLSSENGTDNKGVSTTLIAIIASSCSILVALLITAVVCINRHRAKRPLQEERQPDVWLETRPNASIAQPAASEHTASTCAVAVGSDSTTPLPEYTYDTMPNSNAGQTSPAIVRATTGEAGKVCSEEGIEYCEAIYSDEETPAKKTSENDSESLAAEGRYEVTWNYESKRDKQRNFIDRRSGSENDYTYVMVQGYHADRVMMITHHPASLPTYEGEGNDAYEV